MKDSALVENAGPSITTIVPPGCTLMSSAWAAWWTRWLVWAQNGSAMATCTTTSVSKKVLSRSLVRSINWLGITRSSGANSSLRLPTALTEIIRSTPMDFSA